MLTAIAFEYFATRTRLTLPCWKSAWVDGWTRPTWSSRESSVITDISLDHQKFLGDTMAEIAREKAGIIRPGGVVVTLPQQPQANDVIGNTILDLGARAVSAVPYVPPVSPGSENTASPRRKVFNRRGRGGDREDAANTVRLAAYIPLSLAGNGKTDSGGNPAGRSASIAQCGAGDCDGRRAQPAGLRDYTRNDRAWYSRNALAGTFPGRARQAKTRPNMSSTWRTTPRAHGRCVRRCRLAMKTVS